MSAAWAKAIGRCRALKWYPTAKRMRASYTAYFIAYFVVTMGATWLLSAPRYLAAMISLPAAMSALTENARTERVLVLLSALLFFAYFIFFLLRWQVW